MPLYKWRGVIKVVQIQTCVLRCGHGGIICQATRKKMEASGTKNKTFSKKDLVNWFVSKSVL